MTVDTPKPRVRLDPDDRAEISTRYRAAKDKAQAARELAAQFGCSVAFVRLASRYETSGDDGTTDDGTNGRHPPCSFPGCGGGGYHFRNDDRRAHPESIRVCVECRGRPLSDLPPLREGNAGPVAALLLLLAEERLTLRELGQRLGVLPSEVARVAKDLRLPVVHGRVHPVPVPVPRVELREPENHQVEGEKTMENVELKEQIVKTLGYGPHTTGALARQIGVDTARLSMPLAHLTRSKKVKKIGDTWEIAPREVTVREQAEDAARAINDDPKNNAVAKVVDDHTVEVGQAEPPKVKVTVEASNPEAAAFAQPTADALQAAMNKALEQATVDIPTRLRNRIEELEKDFREVEKAIEAAHIKKGQLSVQIERHRMALGIVEALP